MAIRRKTYKGIYTDENEVFVCDTAADLSLLPTDAPQGSSAFVIEDSTTYMIDSSGVWSEVQIGASGGGDVTLTSIDIAENGTYRAPSGTAYNKVTVAVEDIPDPDPADGKTHIWARIDEDTPDERKGFTLAWNQSVSNGVEIDWGDSGTIVETLSGPVVSFSGDVSVHSIAAGIEPVQSGSGDPSPDNVRPITGWTGTKVMRSRKNMLDPGMLYIGAGYNPSVGTKLNIVKASDQLTDNGDGSFSISLGAWSHRDFIFDLIPGVPLRFSATFQSSNAAVTYGALSKENVVLASVPARGASIVRNVTFTGSEERRKVFVSFGPGESAGTVTVVMPQLELGSSTTDYEPYDGDTFDIAFPSEAGTVYKGTLDVLTGELTATHRGIVLTGDENWALSVSSYNNTFYITNPLPGAISYSKELICSHYPAKVKELQANDNVYIDTGYRLIITANNVEYTLDAWKAYLRAQADAGTPVTVVYKSREGYEQNYQLTPVQIATLLGTNNVWADTGDTTAEIEYYDVQTVSGTGAVSLTHQYENGGEYEITMEAVEGNISFTGTSGTAGTSIYGSKANARCYNRQRITRISVGANAAVGSYMANYCYGLSRVGLPSTLTSIGSYAFEECFSLPSIEIPNGVTSIGEYAFSYCHSLESADIPDTVVSIGAYAFRNCYGLREIDFPSGLTSISDYTYQGCYNLTSIDIPNTVTSIGNGAFHSCYGLTSVRIPAAVRSIGDSAFLNCYGVSEYHIGAATPPTLASTNAFTGMASDCVIYVPRSANQAVLNAYKAATNWVTYASRMQEEAE